MSSNDDNALMGSNVASFGGESFNNGDEWLQKGLLRAFGHEYNKLLSPCHFSKRVL